MSFLFLGIDSLIACLAIGSIVGPRTRMPLAALFGIADGVGFLVGASLHIRLPAAVGQSVQTAVLLALGAYLVGVALLAAKTNRSTSAWPVWLLPAVLSIDNLTFGLVGGHSAGELFRQAGEQALSSALLATIGLVLCVALPRVFPVLRRRTAATGLSGGALMLASGALLLVG